MRHTFPNLVKTPALLEAKQGAECVFVSGQIAGVGVSASAETLSRAIEISGMPSCKRVHVIRLICSNVFCSK